MLSFPKTWLESVMRSAAEIPQRCLRPAPARLRGGAEAVNNAVLACPSETRGAVKVASLIFDETRVWNCAVRTSERIARAAEVVQNSFRPAAAQSGA
jgi:hypothetical protein